MRIKLDHKFEEIISVDNLLLAWQEFVRGKRSKCDVQLFQFNLMDNILQLHDDLKSLEYKHGKYEDFFINDPKPRHIHKATVRDRILHHAVYRILYPFFAKTFIPDSFSCQLDKGTHKAMNRFRAFAYQVGQNNTKTCWVLKCDIRRFFDNIDHLVLKEILSDYIPDQRILGLLGRVIDSFHKGEIASEYLAMTRKKGLPLGNLTSQLFVNIYMNEFDQFVKHQIKAKYYIRYADDFVVLSQSRTYLENMLPAMREFLWQKLKLTMHPDKVFIQTISSGVDFLGWVNFPGYRVLRTVTKKRMFKKLIQNPSASAQQSYLGLLGWGNGYKIKKILLRVDNHRL